MVSASEFPEFESMSSNKICMLWEPGPRGFPVVKNVVVVSHGGV